MNVTQSQVTLRGDKTVLWIVFDQIILDDDQFMVSRLTRMLIIVVVSDIFNEYLLYVKLTNKLGAEFYKQHKNSIDKIEITNNRCIQTYHAKRQWYWNQDDGEIIIIQTQIKVKILILQ